MDVNREIKLKLLAQIKKEAERLKHLGVDLSKIKIATDGVAVYD